MFLCDCTQRSKTSASSVGENDIEIPFLFLDDGIEPIQIRQVRDVSLDAKDISAEAFYGGIKFSLPPASDDHLSAFAEKAFGGGKAETGGSTSYKRDFSIQFTHAVFSFVTEVALNQTVSAVT